MANQIINVVVNSRGAVTVARELDKMGQSAKETTTYLNGLRAVLAAALTFSGAGQIIEVVDNFTALQNRLRQVADETNTVSVSWQRLMNIADQSYSTIDSTVSLYFRVAQAYKAWGESAEDAFEFTELFQKSAILSGSTMQTTSQAVYQFSQALNKGKLDGDEFRSVLEGLPYVASLIQKALGVTRAELYEMSADGQISVDRIKQAFEDAAETIQSDWQNITPTIGMALTVLSNNWMEFVGNIQTSTGIFSYFAQLILLIANNFNLLAIALSPVAISFAFLAGRLGIGLVVMGLKDMATALHLAAAAQWVFNAAVSANPYVIATAAIAAVVAGIIYFRNELGLTNEVLASVWMSLQTGFTNAVTLIMALISPIGMVLSYFVDWREAWDDIANGAVTVKKVVVGMFDSVGNAARDLGSYLSSFMPPIFEDLIELTQSYMALVMELIQLFGEMLAPAIAKILPIMEKLWDFVQPALEMKIKLITDILIGWRNIASYLGGAFFQTVQSVFEGWIVIIREVIGFIQGIIDALRQAISLMKQMTGMGGGGGGGVGMNYGGQFKVGEGYATGGQFKVGGTGAGRDTTPVAFRANRGERVTVETKKQQRAADNSGGAANVNVPVEIINITDPSQAVAAMATPAGKRVIINMIKNDREEFAALLGGAV